MTSTYARVIGSLVAAAALLSVSWFGLSGLGAQTTVWTPTVVGIPSPAAASTGEPQLTVSDRGVLLSWVEHAGTKSTLRFAERTPTGWTPMRTVASGDDWSINGIDVPSVLRLSNGTLVAQWLRPGGAGMHANEVRLSYSKDEGRTWSRALTPYQDGAPNQRLFPTLFEMPNSGLGLIWLNGGGMPQATGDRQRSGSDHSRGADHRGQQGTGHQGHQSHEAGAGAMPAMGGDMALRFAAFDDAWKQIARMPVDARVCECCSTAAVVTSDGVLAAYRNRSDDEIRDIYVSRFTQGRWSEPALVHEDNWHIQACPINGPALSAEGRNVAITWYTMTQDQGHAYLAFSTDAGRRFGEPIRLDDASSLGRVDVDMLQNGSALASWIEVSAGRSQFRVRRVEADGTRSPATTVAALAGSRTYPRLAHAGNEVVLAWTEGSGGEARVRTALVSVPNRSGR